MEKIKVGIIGCGSITEKRHAPEYKDNPNVEIVAFYDINKKRAELMVEMFGGKAVDDYMEILNNPEIVAISDCTPNDMHCLISTTAMKCEKHVLCEKPMAKTLEQAEEIVRTERETGKIFMMDHNQRFTVAHKKVKEIIESGKMGKVISFRTTFGHGGPESWTESKSKNTWFFKKERSKYGVIGDLGVHKLDLIRFLTGDEFVAVSGMGGAIHKTFENGEPIEVYDNAVCVLRMKNGVIGTGIFSWTYYGQEDNSTVIYLEKGIIRIYDDPKYQIKIIYEDGSVTELEVEAIQTNDNQTKTGVIDAFVETIIEKKKSPVTAEDGLKSIKVVDALMRAIEQKCEVEIL